MPSNGMPLVAGSEAPKKDEDSERYYLTTPVQDIVSRLASPVVATVELPSIDQLKVRLVNIDFLDKLDELNSDITLYQSVFFTILGTTLGLTGSAVPTGPLTSANVYSLIAIGFGLVTLAFMGMRLLKLSERRNKLKNKLLLRSPEMDAGNA